MDAGRFFEQLDQLFREKRIEDADAWILNNKRQAMEEADDQVLLSILNEEIGFARSRGEHERSCRVFHEAEALMERLQLPEGAARATTLLNGATAYRAAGKLSEALNLYREAERVYHACGIQDTYENASLFNNMSLLYDQIGMSEDAIVSLMKAREIIARLPDCAAELATTDTNLGIMYLRCGRKSEAIAMLNRAKEQFDRIEGEDAHYWSVLGGLAQAYYEFGDYVKSIAMYERAIDSVEKSFGKNDAFEVLCENAIFVCEQAGEKEQSEQIRRRKQGVAD